MKYDDAYLKAYETVSAARAGIASFLGFYNFDRPHRAYGGKTPDMVYFDSLAPLGAAA